MVKNLQKRNCSGCYFSRLFDGKLHCLKNPPAVESDTGLARWPIVKKNDICGQFKLALGKHITSGRRIRFEIPVYSDDFGDYYRIPLTQGKFAKVDFEDYIRLSQFRWCCKKAKNSIYAVRTVTENGKTTKVLMHRMIAETPPHLVCDHINHDGLDNRRANLRNCTIKQNNANSRSVRNSSSRYKGVCWNKQENKWAASIISNYKRHFLGYYDLEIEAAKAYDKAAKRYHGKFANLNLPQ